MLAKLRDPVSGLSHLAGVVLAIAGLAMMMVAAASQGTVWHVVSFSIYGTSLVLLYLASSLYHLLPLSERGVRTLRRLDHIAIFLLIAGTYTPFCLVPLRGPWGWSVFGVIWGLAVAGIIMKLFWLHAPRWLTAAVYLGMGWMVLVALPPLVRALPNGGLAWLAAGGLCYSGGAAIYATRRPDPWPGRFGFHEIWHLWVLAGSICHFWAIYYYLPRIG